MSGLEHEDPAGGRLLHESFHTDLHFFTSLLASGPVQPGLLKVHSLRGPLLMGDWLVPPRRASYFTVQWQS